MLGEYHLTRDTSTLSLGGLSLTLVGFQSIFRARNFSSAIRVQHDFSPVMVSLVGMSLLALANTILAADNGANSNSSPDASDAWDPLTYVDPLIGASNGGNVFPGASLPYGMAKAVADTNSGSNQGGFTLDGAVVTGFSMMHDSGTGGSPSLGNFPLFPYASCPGGDVNACAYPKKTRAQFGSFTNSSVSARPGNFGLELTSGISVAMTAAQHTALFRFTFPPSAQSGQAAQPLILQDLTDLSDSRQDNGSVSVDAKTGRITGSARFLPSFASGNYVLYFCTDFSGSDIVDNGVFVDSRASVDVKNLTISRSINGYPLPGGAFVRFKSGAAPILARVATSFVSSEQACSHAEAEIPDFDFDAVSTAATAAWRQKLSPIKASTTGVDPSQLTNFYSGIYRTMINPQNYTGENPLWKSSEPYFDSFYWLVSAPFCLSCTYREVLRTAIVYGISSDHSFLFSPSPIRRRWLR